MLYVIWCNSIFSLRELEYRIKQEHIFKSIIQINDVPDYSTFSLRAKHLEKHIYYGVYAMFVELIDPETRLCAIDGTGLRSSKYDSGAKSGKGTRLGYFKGYKLHCIATVTDIIIPLIFDLTTANVYDNQLFDLLYEAKIYNPFLILADAAYDSSDWFNSMLKGFYNLENPRLYGQARYECHIKWLLLAYLVDEFNKKQQGIKSRKYP